MSLGELVRVKQKGGEFPNVFVTQADARLAASLPALRLPRMGDQAREAFRAVLTYEKPPSNGSLYDFLRLVEARGFCAHPCDWVPDFHYATGAGDHPALYQPWVDYLSEYGLSPFHEGNTLTPDNFDRWKPKPRAKAFRRMLREDEQAAYDFLLAIQPTKPASARVPLIEAIDADGSFDGILPRQAPILRYFLSDRSAAIRETAANKLAKLGDLDTEQAHARVLAQHMVVQPDRVALRVPRQPNTYAFSTNFRCTTFDELASALGIGARELAERADLDDLGSGFELLVVLSANVEARSIVASRMLEEASPDRINYRLFEGVARPLWERGLRSTFRSNYFSAVGDYLGLASGSLDPAQMRQLLCYEGWEESVVTELKTGKLPVNKSYDPLRALALVIDKTAAAEVLERALSLGLTKENPRLTMLKLNLAL
jgi:hypothetical protein